LTFDINTLEYQSIDLKLNPKLDYFKYHKIGYYSGAFDKENYELIINSELKQYNSKWARHEK